MRFRVKDWDKFQHFKDRRPPWVKLYRDILDDPDWHELQAETAKVLVMLWLVASEDKEMAGNLPDCRKLAFMLRMSEKEVIGHCSKLSHWLERADIGVISDGYRGDAPETETETETEKSIVGQKPDVSKRAELRNQAKEILAFLNAKAGRAFEEVPANLDRIEARLKEGADFHDCKSIVAKKCMEWKSDEKMADYLRPATLFNREKFWQYHGQLGAQ